MINRFDLDKLASAYRSVKGGYAGRQAALDRIGKFYDGLQWREAVDDEEQEDTETFQITLNYIKASVSRHKAYMVAKPPRVDVAGDTPVARTERFLRSLLTHEYLWGAMVKVLEPNANKYGYGVLQVVWAPEEVDSSTDSDGLKSYHGCPVWFRPRHLYDFYPVYRTYEKPNDFMYVFMVDPERLVDDIEEKYEVKLAGTDTMYDIEDTCELVEYWDKEYYSVFALTTKKTPGKEAKVCTWVVKPTKHNYGRVPFFVLQNLSEPHANPTLEGSEGEVDALVEAQTHLNLIFSERANEILKRIHPPLVYKGDGTSHTYPPGSIKMGAGEVIPISGDEDLAPLDWHGIPEVVNKHLSDTMAALEDLGNLPHTAMSGAEGSSPAGIGMRLAYANLELVLALKVPNRVSFLEEVFRYTLDLLTKNLTNKMRISYFYQTGDKTAEGQPVFGQVDLLKADIIVKKVAVTYGNLLPRDQVEWEQHVVYLFKTGVISHRSALEMLDSIPDPDLELERVKKEKAEALKEGKEQEQGQNKSRDVSGDLKFNAAPPVPQMPSMPTQQNAPFLERGQVPNLGQLGGMQGPGANPGVSQGPPIEGTI